MVGENEGPFLLCLFVCLQQKNPNISIGNIRMGRMSSI